MFRFGSYNVQHCLSYERRLADPACKEVRPADIADVIVREGMDICALQEIDIGTKRSAGMDQLSELLSALSAKTGEQWQGRFAKSIAFDGGEYGVALVTRFPICAAVTRAVAVSPEQKAKDRRFEDRVLQMLTLEIDGHPLTVINTHFGLMPEEQALAVQYVAEEMEKIQSPLLLAGDLNATPESDTVAALSKLLCRAGEAPLPKTHPSDVPVVTIDYIFHTGDLNARAFHAVDTRCSDHRPIVAEISFS